MSSPFAGFGLVIDATTANAATNNGFNLKRTTLGGTVIHRTSDDVAPIRTQLGTVGGNHGFPLVATFANSDGKTEQDLGSLWTDGLRDYVLLAIGKGHTLTMGGDYSRSNEGVISAPVTVNGSLTHVSGAIHRGSIKAHVGAAQLYPSTARVRVTVLCDGVELNVAGQCMEVSVVESYEVLDYADIYEQAKTHIGQSFGNLSIKGMASVKNIYRFYADGHALIDSEVTALTPMRLGRTGMLQSAALTTASPDQAVIRQLPGLRPLGGYDFGRGVDLRLYHQNELVTSGDLVDDAVPPIFSLDRIVHNDQTLAGFAVGYVPTGDQAGSQVQRSRAASSSLWDLRSTHKSYPVFSSGAQLYAGDRVTVQGFRTYLPPDQADKVSRGVAEQKPRRAFSRLWSK